MTRWTLLTLTTALLTVPACETDDAQAETLPCAAAKTEADCMATETKSIDHPSGFGFTACQWHAIETVGSDCSLDAGEPTFRCVQVDGVDDACASPACGDNEGVSVRSLGDGRFEAVRNLNCNHPEYEGFRSCEYGSDGELAPGCACACDAFEE